MKTALITKIVVYTLVAVLLVSILIFGISSGFGLKDLVFGENKGAFSEIYSYESETEDIDNIQVNWVSGPIIIEHYDGSVIQVKEAARSKLKEKEKLQMESKGDTLTIKWNDQNGVLNFSFLNFGKKDKALTVQVPKSMKLDQVEIAAASSSVTAAGFAAEEFLIETASGNIDVEKLTAERIELQNVSGDITANTLLCNSLNLNSVSGGTQVTALTANKVDANSVSGGTSLQGNLLSVKANSVSGSIDVATGLMPTEAELGSVSGGVSMILPENEGFVLQESSISGKLTSASLPLERAGKESYYKDQNAKNKISLNTTSGGMSLEKGTAAEKVVTYEKWVVNQEKKAAAAAKKAEESKE